MKVYNVSLVVEGLTLSDEVCDALFGAFPDAVPAMMDGVYTVSVPVKARNPIAAARRLIDSIHKLFPYAVSVRIDQDLVSIADIAARTGRSRESVRLLVAGNRGPGRFPAPVGTVGDGIRVWPWAVVLEWFRDQMGLELGEHGVPPAVAALIDTELAGMQASVRKSTAR